METTLADSGTAVSPRNEFGLVEQLPAGTRGRGALAALTVGGAALIARPWCPAMFGDAFSYARTAYGFAGTGHFIYNGWATAMLGWQILWGGLFLRVFGFSFDVLRMSVLVLALLSIYLFHQVLARFGISRQLALFGALALGLTPLFFPLAVSFMSDIPGLFVTLLCVALCQRAGTASTAARTVGWLVAAAVTNVAGGTARQICWFGVLVMVPCTAWMLRGRRGVPLTGCVCALVGAVAVRGLLHWFAGHPHAIPEHLNLRGARWRNLVRLAGQEVRSALFLVLMTAPAGVAMLGQRLRLGRVAVVRIGAICGAVAVGVPSAGGRAAIESWTMPWLVPIVRVQGMEDAGANFVTLSLGVRAAISLATLALGLFLMEVAAEAAVARRRERAGGCPRGGAMFWLLGPFSVAIVAAMASRGMFAAIQDRYLLLLIPALLVGLLWGYQRDAGPRVPWPSVGALCVYAAYGIAGLHDTFASGRATAAAFAEVVAGGVPRENVAEGFGPDEWFEIDRRGYVNNVLSAPADYSQYRPNTADWHLPNACLPEDYDLIPSLRPMYVLGARRAGADTGPCYRASPFPPVAYRTWLPPVHREAFAGVPAGKPAGEAPYLRNQWSGQ